ncbi:MAG: hypothetical protein H6779_02845 [Candidatus Nomurabacteria bacterium]|nr:hypothetical protein [Candidatus Nomurabacteria bacterium]USN87327.1 MAG: hypothetical protein H6779_02845 [Candidatus Nomurabacteria bacterium]
MNKPIFIIVGAIIIFILIIIWAYLLFFGTPKSADDIYANFGLGSEEVIDNNQGQNLEEETPIVNTNRPKLRQLTTKMVAGWGEIDQGTTTTELPTIYYVEMGTGHIYSLNLETGEEARVSGTTIVGATTAMVSPAGDYVVMGTPGNSKNTTLTVGEISTSSDLTTEQITTSADSFTLSNDGQELLYSVKESTGLTGHSYNLKTETDKTIFDLPISEAIIEWGSDSSATHYMYPKPASILEGYLAEIKAGKINRLPADGAGFTALANNKIIAYSKNTGTEYRAFIYNRESNTEANFPLPVSFLPEKCITAENTSNFICAYDSSTNQSINLPDSWYQGETNFKDSLWLISSTDLTANLLVDTFTESQREIDVTNLGIGSSEKAVYFINKNDNTLWMYEL